MDTNVTYAKLRTTSRQRNFLAVIAIAMALSVLVLVNMISTREQTVVLVPSLQAETSLSSAQPSPDYLEQVMRDTAGLFLNRHPNNVAYFRENILRMAHPSAHGELEAALIAQEKRLVSTQTSTVFFPTEIYVDPATLYTEIKGTLHTYLGPERVSEERQMYAADWKYQSMRLWLQDFYPVDQEEAISTGKPAEKKG